MEISYDYDFDGKRENINVEFLRTLIDYCESKGVAITAIDQFDSHLSITPQFYFSDYFEVDKDKFKDEFEKNKIGKWDEYEYCLGKDIISFFKKRNIVIKKIETDNSRALGVKFELEENKKWHEIIY